MRLGLQGDGGDGPLSVCTGRSTAAAQGDGSGVGTGVQSFADCWRLSCEGVPGSPVVFPEWTFEQLKNLPEGKGGGILLKKYPERLRTVNIRDRI